MYFRVKFYSFFPLTCEYNHFSFCYFHFIVISQYNKRPMGHIVHLRTTFVHDKIRPQCLLKEKKDIIFTLKTEWS